VAVAPATFAQEKTPLNEALAPNEDGAKSCADIHWPDGFHDLWLKVLKDLSESKARP
jgi:hypothetical protein